jgi:hypothetical protein
MPLHEYIKVSTDEEAALRNACELGLFKGARFEEGEWWLPFNPLIGLIK